MQRQIRYIFDLSLFNMINAKKGCDYFFTYIFIIIILFPLCCIVKFSDEIKLYIIFSFFFL